MPETLILPVIHNGEEYGFEMKIQQGGISRIELIIETMPVIFEPDYKEECRAIVSMYKTFGRKYRANIGRIIKKHRHNKDFAVKYSNQKGEQKMNIFAKVSFCCKRKRCMQTWTAYPILSLLLPKPA